MRKFKFMPKIAAGILSAAMVFGSLSGFGMGNPVVAYAAGEGGSTEQTKKPVSISIEKGDIPTIMKLGESKTLSATVTFDDDSVSTDNIVWTVTGAVSKDTKIDETETNKLIIAKDETAEAVKVTASVKDASTIKAEAEILIGTGVTFDVDYSNMTGNFSTNGDDTFYFLEVLKDSEGEKQGTVYCYDGEEIYGGIDLSFLKLSKDVYVRVYGDKNTTPLKIYTVAKQEKKPSVKYVAGKATLYASFQVSKKDLDADTAKKLQWKTQYGEEWQDFDDLETYIPSLVVAGSTILVRQIDPEWNAPATAEVKVKIGAAPKAPKVTLDYAKDTIKLAKDTQIRVLGWDLPFVNEEKGMLGWKTFYYEVPSNNKDALSPSATSLAETLVKEYAAAYKAEYDALKGKDDAETKKYKDAADKRRNELVADYKDETASEDKGENGEEGQSESNTADASKTPTFDEKLLSLMKQNGYSFLIQTKAGKKAASQLAFVDVQAAPVIAVVKENKAATGEKENWVDTNKIAITWTETKMEKPEGSETEVEKKETKYGDFLTFEWKTKDPSDKKMKEDSLVLKADSSNKSTFAYSIDGGKKWTNLKVGTETMITVTNAKSGVLVRTNGSKEDTKKGTANAWASEAISVPVAVGEITIDGDKEIQVKENDPVNTKAYKVTSVKDFLGNTLKLEEQTITWSVTGEVKDKITFDPKTQILTVVAKAVDKDTTITIKATCGGKEATYEVTIKALEAAK